MEERTLHVHVEVGGRNHPIGLLETRAEGSHEEVAYTDRSRSLPQRLRRALAPSLALRAGPHRSGGTTPLFGAVGDSAPDRWGRTLMRRAEGEDARRERREGRVLREADFLAGVGDEVRAGNLRFAARRGGPFLGSSRGRPLPSLKGLARMLAAVKAYQAGHASRAQLQLLMVTGQLLGGSRPKGSIRDTDGHLAIAKFPSVEDERDMQRWELLVLQLASACGITVPAARVVRVAGESVLVSRRFDREPLTQRRIGFVSMMGLLEADDNKSGSYLEIARAIRRFGGRPQEDLRELWRRAAFAVLVSDKDNHLRNHGLLLLESGWRLAPAFDMNATPQQLRPRSLAISLDGVDDRASLEPLLDRCADFGFTLAEALRALESMARVVRRWREGARRLRLPASQVRKMAPAFEHEALARALRGRA